MVIVSETAAEQLKGVIQSVEERESKTGLALRVYVRGQCGCGTVHYGLGLDDETREGDREIRDYGFPIRIDADSATLVEGAEIDYIDEPTQKGFTVRNPNSSGCSCGH